MLELRQTPSSARPLWSQKELPLMSCATASPFAAFPDQARINMPPASMAKFGLVLEQLGIDFLPELDFSPVILQGPETYWMLRDDICSTLEKTNSELCIFGADEGRVATLFNARPSEYGEKLSRYVTRLQKTRASCRALLKAGDINIIAPTKWYRIPPAELVTSSPLYVYGDKVALINFEPGFEILVYENAELANKLRIVFNDIWNRADELK